MSIDGEGCRMLNDGEGCRMLNGGEDCRMLNGGEDCRAIALMIVENLNVDQVFEEVDLCQQHSYQHHAINSDHPSQSDFTVTHSCLNQS